MAEAESRDKPDLFQDMTKVASAMTIIPAVGAEARGAKHDVAGWSASDAGWTIRLPGDLISALQSN
ncbi:hypothetical protein FHT77_000934 [Rhizobium sp. BK181]|uniref:hypothetical protein n=1 Tax=Rhizobium sp. BK181 TaxID=2587072 RepID=UPI00160EF140|nr:hypothetical protein [Rhizobium sp. BK181]MBB3315092.1 hypothetical protein [Rhizobium sp. BK181]